MVKDYSPRVRAAKARGAVVWGGRASLQYFSYQGLMPPKCAAPALCGHACASRPENDSSPVSSDLRRLK